MSSPTFRRSERPAPDPCRVTGILMVALTPLAVREAESSHEVVLSPTLRTLRAYVFGDESGTASFLPLHPELVKGTRDGRWQIAIPKTDARHPELARIQVLTLAPGDDASAFEAMLREDKQHIAYAHLPAVRLPLAEPTCGGPFDPDDPQWGLLMCGFPDVWSTLETGPVPKPVGIIDKGGDKGHSEIQQVFSQLVPHQLEPAAGSNHGEAVAAIIGAKRTYQAGERMVGCCSAMLALYNVWPNQIYDPCAYYRALRRVAELRLPVLNLSLGWVCDDATEKLHIETCISESVVVVAAMGNDGEESLPYYPAVYDKVVAVGGVNASNGPSASSSQGSHMWISAPGENILTISDETEYTRETGTSYAAAFVTAAVWLARRYRPCLTVDEVRAVLKESVAPDTVPKNARKHSPDVGHGRLDVRCMAGVLNRITCGDARPARSEGDRSSEDPA